MIQKKPETIRILCLGDSFTLGYGVDDERTYPEYLYQKLSEKYPGKKFEVINTGSKFFTVYDALDYYEEKGHKLNADLVILQFYWNDVLDLKNELPFRKYYRNSWGIKHEYNNSNISHLINYSATYNTIAKLKVLFNKDSYFKMSGNQEKKIAKREKGYIDLNESENEFLSTMIHKTMEYEYLHRLKRLWQSYIEGMLSLRKQVEEKGSQFLFIPVPYFMQVLPPDDYRRLPDVSPYRLNIDSNVFNPASRKYDFHMINLTLPFRNATTLGKKLYLRPIDHHCTKEGNELIANEIVKHLKITYGKNHEANLKLLKNNHNFNYSNPKTLLVDLLKGSHFLNETDFLKKIHISSKGYIKGETINNGNYYLRNHSATNSEFLFELESSERIKYLSIISYNRMFHDKKGLANIKLEYSFDKKNFKTVYNEKSNKTGNLDVKPTLKLSEIFFEESSPKKIYIKYTFKGLSGFVTSTSMATNNPRLEFIFYPEQKNEEKAYRLLEGVKVDK